MYRYSANSQYRPLEEILEVGMEWPIAAFFPKKGTVLDCRREDSLRWHV